MSKRPPMSQAQIDAINLINDRVKKLFAKQSQAEIGKKCGMSQGRTYRLMASIRNRMTDTLSDGMTWCSIPELVSIADAYNVSLASLVEREKDAWHIGARDLVKACWLMEHFFKSELTFNYKKNGAPVLTLTKETETFMAIYTQLLSLPYDKLSKKTEEEFCKLIDAAVTMINFKKEGQKPQSS